MTGVDKDLATLREVVRSDEAGWDGGEALDRVEAELAELVARATQAEADRGDVERRWCADVERLSADMARLREERDASKRPFSTMVQALNEADKAGKRAEAAEARCARLQQALVACHHDFDPTRDYCSICSPLLDEIAATNRNLVPADFEQAIAREGGPVRCCAEWPECSHMLAYYEASREALAGPDTPADSQPEETTT